MNTWSVPVVVFGLGVGDVGLRLGVAEGDAVGLGEGVELGLGLGDGVELGLGLGEGEGVGLGVGDCVGEGVGDGEGVRVGPFPRACELGSAITSCGGLDPSRLEKLSPSVLVELTLNEYDPFAVTPLIGVLIHVPVMPAGSEPTWEPLGGAVFHVTLASVKAEVAYTCVAASDGSVTNTRSVAVEPGV